MQHSNNVTLLQTERTSYITLKQRYTITLGATLLFFLLLYLTTMRARITTPTFSKKYACPHGASCRRAVRNVNIAKQRRTCSVLRGVHGSSLRPGHRPQNM